MAYGIGGYVKKRKEKDSAGQNREQKERTGLNHEDLALKTAAQYFGDELLPLLGIPGRVKYIAPTENVKLQDVYKRQLHDLYRAGAHVSDDAGHGAAAELPCHRQCKAYQ